MTETAEQSPKLVMRETVSALMKQKLTRICNRAEFDTLRTGIDLDLECWEACLKIAQAQPLDAVLGRISARHPAAPQVLTELRRLYASAWPSAA